MSDAPERIWIAGSLSEYGRYYAEAVEAEGEHGGFAKEYVRADLHAAALAEAQARIAELEGTKPRVKPLVWGSSEKQGMFLQADCPFGRYYIADKGEYGFAWWRPATSGAHMGIEPGLISAYKAAQADYESRILSALET